MKPTNDLVRLENIISNNVSTDLATFIQEANNLVGRILSANVLAEETIEIGMNNEVRNVH